MKIKVIISRQENADFFQCAPGDTVTVELEDYVAAVVASEIGNALPEAAKAQAVAARTFAWPYYSKDKAITDKSSTHQAYRAKRANEKEYPNAVQAARDTAGQLLTYNGSVIPTCSYSANNGGRTVSSQERWGGSFRPWLIAQDDPWDRAAGSGKTGHGVGMSQRGAKYAASIGKSYTEILAFYYPGTTITGGSEAMSEQTAAAPAMDRASKVVEAARSQMGSPYVFGAWGSECTPSMRKKYASYHPEYAENIRKACPVLSGTKSSCEGCKWKGCLAFDCRGFTHWALMQAGIKIDGSGATSQYNTKANWQERGTIDKMPDRVCCLFKYKEGKMSHTGLHIGGGQIIHCSKNVKEDKLPGTPAWTHYAIPVGLYDGAEATPAPQTEISAAAQTAAALTTLKTGSRGSAVTALQEGLNRLGYACGAADGIFGSKTQAAVRQFQAANGLAVDGIAGDKTLTTLAFRLAVLDSVPATPVIPVTYTVTIPNLDEQTAARLMQEFPQAVKTT